MLKRTLETRESKTYCAYTCENTHIDERMRSVSSTEIELETKRKCSTEFAFPRSYGRKESKEITSEERHNKAGENEDTGRGQGGEIDESGPSTMTTPSPSVLISGFVARKKNEKPYVPLNPKTDLSRISECLFDHWEMVDPDVIFSVISDSEYSTAKGNEVIEEMSNGSVKNICRSLVTAAASTKAWMITGALDKSIDHLIGREVRQRQENRDKIPGAVLGISCRGCLAETKDLLKDSGGSISNSSELQLNPANTHILPVHDDTQMKPCSGCSIREKVELALMKGEAIVTEKNQNRPLIYILIGGYDKALGVVERALAHGIPVIYVVGSGGAADKIDLNVRGTAAFKERHNKTDLLIKFDINDKQKEGITNVIIETLKNQQCTKPIDVFMLAADWDMEQFFRQLLQEKWKWQEHQRVLVKLLEKGKNKYAKLILEQNCDSRWLMELEDGPLRNHISEDVKNFKTEDVTMINYRDWFSKIIDGKKADNRIIGKFLFLCFTWANIPEVAMLFWERGQDCLAMALVGYKVSRKRMKDLKDKRGYEQMKNQVEFFSKMALDFVRKCYEDDSKQTQNLLIGKVEALNNRTPLQIAVDSEFRAFISMDAVRDLLNNIWVNHLQRHDKYKYIPMILSEACPILAPWLFEISDDVNMILSEASPLLAPRLFEIADESNSVKQNSTEQNSTEQNSTEKNSTEQNSTEQNSTEQNRTTTYGCAYMYMRKHVSEVKRFIDIPLVKFSYAFISFLAYLTLFSIVLLTDFGPKISPMEIALIIWTFILLVEEVRQAIVDIREYKGNKWNYLDIGAQTLYIIGFVLRTIYHGNPKICPHCLYHARIVLAFSLMIFFLRTLQFLSVYERLGPKIFMMYQLVADLASFLAILAVFISAYGVVSNVILYPNRPLNGNLLGEVFYDAWWSVIQQFNMDALGSKCAEDPTANITADFCSSTTDVSINYTLCKEKQCPANSWIVHILLAIYSLITCVMLLNVLIAIFNSTFEDINKEQTEVWRMQRYRLIREFNSRSMVPPPLCVVTYPYFIIQELHRRRKISRSPTSDTCRPTSTTDIENKETSLYDDNAKKSRSSKSSLDAFEKDLETKVQDWEHKVVVKFLEENKEDRKVCRHTCTCNSPGVGKSD